MAYDHGAATLSRPSLGPVDVVAIDREGAIVGFASMEMLMEKRVKPLAAKLAVALAGVGA